MARRIALAYLALGLLWILGSDGYLLLTGRQDLAAFVSGGIKGIGFVAASALAVYLLAGYLPIRRRWLPGLVALTYLVLGLAWIVASDWYLYGPGGLPDRVLSIQLLKGSAFVVVSAFAIFLLAELFNQKVENMPGNTGESSRDPPRWDRFLPLRLTAMFSIMLLGLSLLLDVYQLTVGGTITGPDFLEHLVESLFLTLFAGTTLFLLLHVFFRAAQRAARDATLAGQRYQSLFEHNPSAVYLLDPDGRFVDANPALCRLVGLPHEKVLGESWERMAGPGQVELIREHFHSALQGNPQTFDTLARWPDGETLHVQVTLIPRYEDDRVAGVYGVARDITSEKTARDQIAASEERFRALFQHSLDAIFLTRPDGTIESANPAAETMLGLSEAEIIKRGRDGVLDTNDPSLPKVLAEREQTGRTRGVLHFRRSDGSTFPAETTSAIFEDSEGRSLAFVAAHDISERERREAALRVSEARTRSLFEYSMDAILLSDPDAGVLLACNPAAEELFGSSEEELKSRQRDEVFDTESPEFAEFIRQRDAAGHARGVLTAIRADGDRVPVEVTTTLFRDEEGHRRSSVILRDISESLRRERALRESEDRYRALFESSADAILITNPEGTIFDANPAAERLFGLSKSELCKIGRAGLVDADEPARKKLLADRIAHGHAQAEIHMRRGDGTWFLADINTVGFRERSGEDHTSVVIRDITESRRQQIALEQSEERLRATVEASLDPIVGMDTDGRIIQFNEAAERSFGYPREQVLGKPLIEQLIPERLRKEHREDLRRYLESGTSRIIGKRIEIGGLRADGEEFPAELAVNVAEGPSGTTFVGYMRDLTERRRQEQALRESEERFRSIFEHSPDAILNLDPETGRILTVNAAAERLFGLDKEAFTALERSEHSDVNDPAFQAFLEERNRTGHARATLTMFRGDGTGFPADVTSAMFHDSRGRARATAIVRDITKQREREAEIRASEERYRAVFEQSMDAILVSNPESHTIVGVNPAAKSLFGLTEEEICARRPEETMDLDDPASWDYFETRQREGQVRTRLRMKRGDGTWFTAEVNSRLFHNAAGQRMANTVLRDITEQEEYERQLAESEQRFRIVADNTGQVIYEIDLETNDRVWAGACRQMFGYDQKELQAMPARERLMQVPKPERERVAACYRDAARAGGGFHIEYPLETRDGGEILVEDTGIVLRELGRMYGVIQDVTENRRLVRDLEAREQALGEVSRVQQTILDALPAHIALLDEQGAIQYINAAWRGFAENNEYQGLDAGVGSNYLAICDATRGRDRETAQATARGIRQVMAGKRDQFGIEYPCHSPEERRWFQLSVTPFRGGDRTGAVVAHMNISDRREAERQLELVATAFRSADEAMLICNSDFEILEVNLAYERISGRTRDDAIGNRPLFLEIEQQERNIRRGLEAEGQWRGELLQRRMDGQMFVARASVSQVPDPESGTPHLVVNYADISELRDYEQQVDYLSYHDPLTGLPNRIALTEWFQGFEPKPDEGGELPHLAFVFINLDRLKTVNDAYGHNVGDELITELGRRLLSVCEGDDYVARLIGDEFAMVMTDVSDDEALQEVRRRMERLNAPLKRGEFTVYPTVCAGIALSPEHGTSLEQLLRKADVAMHEAKQLGRGEVVLFTTRMSDDVEEQLLIERNLRDGIDNREFLLHYQPSVLLDGGRIIGVEALVRWENPQLGLVAPDRFIPVAEDSGLIIDLGDWVFEEVCRQIGEWQSEDVPFGWIAVNLSPMQFQDPNLLAKIRAGMENHGVTGDQIRVEITENVLVMDPDWTTRVLESLRELGIRVAVDDFGTGYSSLAYLKRFPVDFVKLDKTFVAGLPQDAADASIVASVVDLARRLGMGVVAEGIERDEQRIFLMDAGCLEAQGYFFSLPLRNIDLRWLLKSHQTLPVGKPAGKHAESSGIE